MVSSQFYRHEQVCVSVAPGNRFGSGEEATRGFQKDALSSRAGELMKAAPEGKDSVTAPPRSKPRSKACTAGMKAEQREVRLPARRSPNLQVQRLHRGKTGPPATAKQTRNHGALEGDPTQVTRTERPLAAEKPLPSRAQAADCN